MRVLSVLTTDAAGGAEYAAVDLLAALARRGIAVRLLTNRPALASGTEVEAATIDLGPKLSRRSARRLVVSAPVVRRRLARALAAEPHDVLLLHFKKEQLLAATLPRDLTRAVVWAEWGPLPPPLRSGVPRRVYALAAQRAARVVAESTATARSIIAAGVDPDRLVIAGNVFDGDRLTFSPAGRARIRAELGLDDRAFVCGAVSRFHDSKRLEVLIDALAHLPADVTLVLAGDGPAEAALRAHASRYATRVRFLPTPRGYVADVLSALDLQIYAPSGSEGAARAVTLGQLTARPVVATAAEGTSGLLPPDAVIVPERDPHALARAISAWKADPGRARRAGDAGRARALARLSEHDPARVVQQALAVAMRQGER